MYPGLGCGPPQLAHLLCPFVLVPSVEPHPTCTCGLQGLEYHLGPVLFPGPWTVRASCSWVSLGSCLGPLPPDSHLLCVHIFPCSISLDCACGSSCLGVQVSFSCGSAISLTRSRTHFASHCPHKSQGSPCTQASL